jgi:signal transduction histidine kinase
MTKDELTQGNIDDVTLVSKHETKAMGFMMFKVSEQELLDARNAVIKRMLELRNAAMDVCNNARQSEDPHRYSVSATLINNLEFLLTGM